MLRAKKRKLLNEQEGGTTGAIGGFTGRAGQDIDDLFAGPYHPDYGDIEKLLQFQLDRRDNLVKWSNRITPILKNIFELVGIEYRIDKPLSKYDKETLKNFINDTNKMQEIDINIKYDNISNTSKEHFINKTNDWQIVYKNKVNGED
tara:strand:- start:827 stop:1267 length:441 start_codon:yes stop_codon:yes gene_type:complete